MYICLPEAAPTLTFRQSIYRFNTSECYYYAEKENYGWKWIL